MALRTFKFKGKIIDNDEWVYGYLADVQEKNGYATIDYVFDDGYEYWESCEHVYVNTVCQFTGLKDRNGVEIYEGDLLKVWCLPFADAEEEIAKVNWDEKRAGFILLYNNGSYHYFDDVMEVEVVGNIHDTIQNNNTQ